MLISKLATFCSLLWIIKTFLLVSMCLPHWQLNWQRLVLNSVITRLTSLVKVPMIQSIKHLILKTLELQHILSRLLLLTIMVTSAKLLAIINPEMLTVLHNLFKVPPLSALVLLNLLTILFLIILISKQVTFCSLLWIIKVYLLVFLFQIHWPLI